MNHNIKEIVDFYGKEHQANLAMEECAELIQAINKRLRYPDSYQTHLNLVEEMADVYIMLHELMYVFGITPDEFDKWIEIKSKRIVARYKELKNG